jgi:Ca2+-binding EF-hand superfamily protein
VLKELKKAFKLFDKDNDGKINASELEAVLSGDGKANILRCLDI